MAAISDGKEAASSIFRNAEAYDQLMGRWSRRLATAFDPLRRHFG